MAASSSTDNPNVTGDLPWTVETLREKVFKYCAVELVVSDGELDEIGKINRAGDNYPHCRFREVQVENPENPAMFIYMNDGWGSFVSSHTSVQDED